MLQNEFPSIPLAYIYEILRQKKSLYASFAALDATEKDYENLEPQPYVRLKKARRFTSSSENLLVRPVPNAPFGKPAIVKELAAARRRRRDEERQQQLQKDAEEAEALNIMEHEAQGSMIECQCCFSDAPMNRVISCNNDEVHFFCHQCIRNLVANEIGMSRSKVICMDASDCKATFAREQLRAVLEQKTLKRLEYLEQQAEIDLADIDGLSECPFCDFKAIYPPVEEDREFRCMKPECEKISCRLCNEETHIPKSCDEAKKDKGLPARHHIEEAMSDALIRQCPKCKVKIVKLDGCNKMTCTKCGCVMCYVCKKDITGKGRGLGYEHFGDTSGCQLHDEYIARQGFDRHAMEVEQAEKTAIEEAKRQNPDLEGLELNVSKSLPSEKPPPEARPYVPNIHNAAGGGRAAGVRQAQAQAQGGPYGGPPVMPPFIPPAMPRLPGPAWLVPRVPFVPETFYDFLDQQQQEQRQQLAQMQQQLDQELDRQLKTQREILDQQTRDLEQQIRATLKRRQPDNGAALNMQLQALEALLPAPPFAGMQHLALPHAPLDVPLLPLERPQTPPVRHRLRRDRR